MAILNALIPLILIIISTFLIPWLKSKAKTEQQSEWLNWADEAVRAAEQIHGAGNGTKKKAYVLKFLECQGLTGEQAEVLLESSVNVYNLHKNKGVLISYED